MKKRKLSYDEWRCIEEKHIHGRQINTSSFEGYIGLIDIEKVSTPQVWKFNGEDTVVCDKGLKWLTILPKNDFYCITAMLNEKNDILLWYIDMIASQEINHDGIPSIEDLYLDLVVYPDGTIIEDDMDELLEALSIKDISNEQYQLAIDTSMSLKKGLLSNIDNFIAFTYDSFHLII